MGRPSKLTDDTQTRIVQAIQLGATYELAAQYGSVAYNTFNEWMKKGEEANTGRYREFYEAVKKAEGMAVVGWLAKIEKAANDGNWQAAAWKLERRYPQDYGRQVQQLEHSGKIQTEDVGLTDEERASRILALLDRARERRDRSASSGD